MRRPLILLAATAVTLPLATARNPPSTAPCAPPAGRTALVIGQDAGSIANLTAAGLANASGTMAYTDVEALSGLAAPAAYGSGVEFAAGSTARHPGEALQLALWMVGSLEVRPVACSLPPSRDEEDECAPASSAAWRARRSQPFGRSNGRTPRASKSRRPRGEKM